jgi:tetratricopeptide (TPR) repeat protein/tRNA A-37 threonylcarbamoyl transferase component Bud32
MSVYPATAPDDLPEDAATTYNPSRSSRPALWLGHSPSRELPRSPNDSAIALAQGESSAGKIEELSGVATLPAKRKEELSGAATQAVSQKESSSAAAPTGRSKKKERLARLGWGKRTARGDLSGVPTRKDTAPEEMSGLPTRREPPAEFSTIARPKEIEGEVWTIATRRASEGDGKTAPDKEALSEGSAFTLRRIVGRGGMGEVWEARQESLGRLVAVKTLRAEAWEKLALDPETRRRAELEFRQEALASARLDHPNIVPVHELGWTADSRPLLAMKLARGQAWDALLKTDFPLLSPEALLARHLPILEDMAQAVAFAHSRGIIHRDLKPSQAMVGPFGETLLMDWGLAVQFIDPMSGTETQKAACDGRPESELPTLQTASNPAGTPALMAPEQTRDSPQGLGPWTDIYLLGGTLYYLLTGGDYPHKAPSAKAAMSKAMLGDVEPPSVKAPSRWIPAELEALAMRALEKEPRNRVPSAGKFMEALRDYMSGASRQRESAELAAQAEEGFRNLEGAKALGVLSPRDCYMRHGVLAERLSRALELWSGNEIARRLRAQNLASCLETEIAAGDLMLAEMHLGELRGLVQSFPSAEINLDALERPLGKALARREEIQRQRVVLAWTALVLVFCVVGFAWGLFLNVRETNRQRDLAESRRLAAEEANNAERESRQKAEAALLIAQQQGAGAYKLVDFALRDLKTALDQELTLERGLTPESASVIAHGVAGKVASPVTSYFASLDTASWPDAMKVELAQQRIQTGSRFRKLGRLDEALALMAPGVKVLEELLPPDHEGLGTVFNNLGLLLYERGEYAQALPLLERSLEIAEKAEHPDQEQIASTLHNLARFTENAGDYAAARAFQERALAIYEEKLGPEHPETASSLSGLGVILRKMGQLEVAQGHLERALRIEEKTLSPDDPALSITQHNLAGVLSDRGDWQGALGLYKRALEETERIKGPNHPSTAISLASLGAFYHGSLKDYRAAIRLYERAIAIYGQTIGREHPLAATALSNLGSALGEIGQREESQRLMEEALAIREKVLGPDHPDTATSINNLAVALTEEGKFQEALPLFERSLAATEKTLGPDHPETAHRLNNLAMNLTELGRVAEARPMFERALAIREKVFGPDHLAVAQTLNKLADLFFDQGNFARARPMFERVVAIREKRLGPDHPDAAEGLFDLAMSWRGVGDREKAIALLERAVAIREKTVGLDHSTTAFTLNNLSVIYKEVGNYEKAIAFCQRAVDIREKLFGPEALEVAYTLNNMIRIHLERGDLAAALVPLERSVAIFEKTLGPDDSKTTGARFILAKTLRDCGRAEEAKPHVERLLSAGWPAQAPEKDRPAFEELRRQLGVSSAAELPAEEPALPASPEPETETPESAASAPASN